MIRVCCPNNSSIRRNGKLPPETPNTKYNAREKADGGRDDGKRLGSGDDVEVEMIIRNSIYRGQV